MFQTIKNLFKKTRKTDTIYYNNPLRDQRSFLHVRQNVTDWAHYIHKNRIILARAFEFDDPWSREIVCYYHPFQWANIHKVAEAISSDRILLIPPSQLDNEEPTPMKQLQNKWDRNYGQFLLKKAIEKGRKHGWVLYVPVQAKYLPEYYSGPPWHVYSADEAKAIDWDIFGHPIKWLVQPTNHKIDAFELSVKDCFFFDVYQTDDFDGHPEGSQIWDDLIDYIFSKEAWASFNQRMGNGFLILPVPMGTPEDVKSSYQQKIMNVRTEMGLIWEVDDEPGSALSGQKPEWMTPQGSADFINHLEKLEDGIATGMGFPKRWLKGDQEGAMEAGGKDKLQVHSKLSAIFNQWKRFIVGVCLHHKWISDYGQIEVRAGFKMELSDEEKFNLDLIKTQTIAAKTWLSINEQRELDGYEAVEEEGASEVMVLDKDPNQGNEEGDTPPKSDSPNNSKNDMIDPLIDYFNAKGVHKIAKEIGVSPTTVSKIREGLEQYRYPHQKVDILDLKQDSVQIADNIYEFEGVVLQPQKKFYPQYNAHCITPKEEIERIFNDPTYPKEYRIGVTNDDDHNSPIPSEVLEGNAIGTVKYEKLLENGQVFGKVRIDLTKTDKVLGSDNWLRTYTSSHQAIPLSVARWTVDKPQGDDRLETQLDIRSYVATRKPRNEGNRVS